MRPSIANQILCSAAAVSSLTLPRSLLRRQQLVDLSIFGPGFQTITLEEAKANAEINNAKNTLTNTSSSSSTGAGKDGNVQTAETDAEDGTVTTQAGTCTAPATRIEWRSLSDADKTAFVQAVRCLVDLPASGAFSGAGSQNRYEDLVAVHSQMTGSIHSVAQFLPWHRYYVHVFESLLREECSYAGPMTWWNEALDAGNFASSPVFNAQWFGSGPLKTSDGQGTCIADGAFGGITLHVGGDRCLSRAIDESATSNCNTDFVNSCNSNNAYSDMESCSEFGPHGYGHNGVGAVMSQVPASPSDPVFFMHHGFVDHSWVLWQNADIPNRLYQVNGCSDTANPCTQLTTNYVLSSQGLRPDATVNDVMDTQGGYLCYVYDS
ncbi:uncharacterized protein JN550_009879 [Neoarthrinium moseri]|uniref:uncharacterized protein n=1 Tax=Neoarthrinium moseri TaxID=1658444 RepID=UPI001FDC423A|nr:uncharacterized protein JN550_009879 [Neoarthrinium moseri]KAI1863143.1 hypothetical protein JN550_009879 [Neoarthrinium moseri]